MPVRSLSSSVLEWPDATTVDHALRDWAEKAAQDRKDVLRVGYFGSYARGDWGVGSDLDIVIIVEESDRAFERRSVEWDATMLPVPVDVLVYTKREWQVLSQEGRFGRFPQEVVWVYHRNRL